jgi:hypothetical protein
VRKHTLTILQQRPICEFWARSSSKCMLHRNILDRSKSVRCNLQANRKGSSSIASNQRYAGCVGKVHPEKTVWKARLLQRKSRMATCRFATNVAVLYCVPANVAFLFCVFVVLYCFTLRSTNVFTIRMLTKCLRKFTVDCSREPSLSQKV